MVTDPLELLLEVLRGSPPPAGEAAADRALRQRLEREVEEIAAKGGIVHIPSWTP